MPPKKNPFDFSRCGGGIRQPFPGEKCGKDGIVWTCHGYCRNCLLSQFPNREKHLDYRIEELIEEGYLVDCYGSSPQCLLK